MKTLSEFVVGSVRPADVLDASESTLRQYIASAVSKPRSDELGAIESRAAILSAAVELPHHSQLKPEYKGMYERYDSGCADQHWGTEPTVLMALNLAYNWWKQGNTPTMLLGDISAKTFSQTGCHSAHKTGTHVDADLSGTLPRDPGYNQDKQLKCAIVCWFAIQLGTRRVLFSDDVVAQAVNQIAAEKGFAGRVEVRADHDNHFHFEM
jgi:murein endopeptidase